MWLDAGNPKCAGGSTPVGCRFASELPSDGRRRDGHCPPSCGEWEPITGRGPTVSLNATDSNERTER
jgi:hypothetical protein